MVKVKSLKKQEVSDEALLHKKLIESNANVLNKHKKSTSATSSKEKLNTSGSSKFMNTSFMSQQSFLQKIIADTANKTKSIKEKQNSITSTLKTVKNGNVSSSNTSHTDSDSNDDEKFETTSKNDSAFNPQFVSTQKISKNYNSRQIDDRSKSELKLKKKRKLVMEEPSYKKSSSDSHSSTDDENQQTIDSHAKNNSNTSSSSDEENVTQTVLKVDNSLRKKVDTKSPSRKDKINIIQNIVISDHKHLKQKKLHEIFKNLHQLKDVTNEFQIKTTLDNEYYLVQIPSQCKPDLIVDTKINLKKSNKIRIGDESFVCNYTQESENSFVMFAKCNNGCTEIIMNQPAGFLRINEHLKSENNEIEEFNIKETEPVEFPKHLKLRHPLFNVDYEKINVDEMVSQELIKAYERPKKKKKKSNKESKLDDFTDISKFLDDIEDDSRNKKRHRSKKDKGNTSNVEHQQKHEKEDDNLINSFLEEINVKKSRKKRKVIDE